MPTFCRISARCFFPTGSPATVTVPVPPLRMPFRCSTRVVFPAPFGPSSATRSPRPMPKSTPNRAWWPSG